MKTQQQPNLLAEMLVHSLTEADDQVLSEHGKSILLSAFGNMQNVVQFMTLNGITPEDVTRTQSIDGIDLS